MSRGLTALAPPRGPAAPGPGPMPEALLRALDLTVRHRLDGMLPGDDRSTALGIATELAQVRLYEPGDDARRIDWNVTARTGEPHVRVDIAERALTTWLVLDVSPSMLFGTADRRKADVAEGVALAIAHVARRSRRPLGCCHVRRAGHDARQTLPGKHRRRLAARVAAPGAGRARAPRALACTMRFARQHASRPTDRCSSWSRTSAARAHGAPR